MLRSLFAGISGLRTNQTMLDVTGNNIANANTIGFKSSTTVFKDTLSQMLTAASSSSPGRGGTNAMQVGLGVQVGAIATNLGQGAAQTTGRTTDLMIQGDGMFVVHKGAEALYTRAGAFTFDEKGYLTTPSGNLVQGYAFDRDHGREGGGAVGHRRRLQPADVVHHRVRRHGARRHRRRSPTGGVQKDLYQIAIADFDNPMGLEKVGETSFRESANSGAAHARRPRPGPPGHPARRRRWRCPTSTWPPSSPT